MLEDKKISVIIPAYNEEKLISNVIETMPCFVDLIIIIDDCSTDKTVEIINSYKEKIKERLEIIVHNKNQGVGASIVSGYNMALNKKMDIMAVMAGDAQMDPNELKSIVSPVINNEADYVKGNRFYSGDAWKIIPKIRYFAGIFLSFLTKIVSGYWHIADSQCGFTAISSDALRVLDFDNIYKRYGVPNDILTKLNINNFKVKDVSIRPIYNQETSGIKYKTIIFTLSFLLCRLFFHRMWHKYVIRDFHPLILFYLFGSVFFVTGVILGGIIYFVEGYLAITLVVFCAVLFMSGIQFLLFAMWFDMEYNKPFCVK